MKKKVNFGGLIIAVAIIVVTSSMLNRVEVNAIGIYDAVKLTSSRIFETTQAKSENNEEMHIFDETPPLADEPVEVSVGVVGNTTDALADHLIELQAIHAEVKETKEALSELHEEIEWLKSAIKSSDTSNNELEITKKNADGDDIVVVEDNAIDAETEKVINVKPVQTNSALSENSAHQKPPLTEAQKWQQQFEGYQKEMQELIAAQEAEQKKVIN